MKKSKAVRKREAESDTLLKVPNTRKGRKFLEDLRTYRVTGTRVWARARGPRAVHAREVHAAQYGARVESIKRHFAEGRERQKNPESMSNPHERNYWMREDFSPSAERRAIKQMREYDGARMYDQDLPREFAREFSIYMWKPAVRERGRERLSAAYRQSPVAEHWSMYKRDVERLQADKVELIRQRDEALRVADLARDPRAEKELARLTADRAELMQQRDALQATAQRLRNQVQTLTHEVNVWKNAAHKGSKLLH